MDEALEQFEVGISVDHGVYTSRVKIRTVVETRDLCELYFEHDDIFCRIILKVKVDNSVFVAVQYMVMDSSIILNCLEIMDENLVECDQI